MHHPPQARPEPRRGQRWRTLAWLAAVAVALHALLLAGVAASGAPGRPGPAAAAMLVRSLPAEPAQDEPATPAPAAKTRPLQPAAPTPARPASRRRAAPQRAAIDTAPGDAAPVEPPAPLALAAADSPDAAAPAAPAAPATASAAPEAQTAPAAPNAAAPQPGADASPALPAAAAGDDEIPVYKTVIPPPLTLVYQLSRGLLSGTGTLTWRPQGDRYQARLDGRVAGLNVLTQVSQGGFDEAGLAPARFTDQRMGREVRAANFQREHGKITFSGPSNEFTLLVGTQDRLSWLVQLSAIVSAEPKRLAPGGKIALYVVGARGDAALWVFRFAGEETVSTAAGDVRAARFSREARGPYDTQADAWLDPARHGIAVRARLGNGNDGEALELVLREMSEP